MRGCGFAIMDLTAAHPASAQEPPSSAIEARNMQGPATPVAALYAAAGDGNT